MTQEAQWYISPQTKSREIFGSHFERSVHLQPLYGSTLWKTERTDRLWIRVELIIHVWVFGQEPHWHIFHMSQSHCQDNRFPVHCILLSSGTAESTGHISDSRKDMSTNRREKIDERTENRNETSGAKSSECSKRLLGTNRCDKLLSFHRMKQIFYIWNRFFTECWAKSSECFKRLLGTNRCDKAAFVPQNETNFSHLEQIFHRTGRFHETVKWCITRYVLENMSSNMKNKPCISFKWISKMTQKANKTKWIDPTDRIRQRV